MRKDSETLLDRVYTKLKNNSVVTCLVIAATVVTGIASFVDSTEKISGFFSESDTPPTIAAAPPSVSDLAAKIESPLALQPPDQAEPLSPVTFEEFAHNMMSVGGNQAAFETPFAKSTYLDSLIGRRVIWQGMVSNLTKVECENCGVVVTLEPSGPKPTKEMAALFNFTVSGNEVQTLRANDLVQVTGVIREYDAAEDEQHVSFVELDKSQLLRLVHRPLLK